MRWDDSWIGASKDLALHVVKNPGTAAEQVVNNLNDPQSGHSTHVPFEFKKFKTPVAGTYAFVVKKLSGAAPSWIQLASFDSLPHVTTGHSVLSPADSAHNGAMAVGAAWSANSSIRWFSSLGPTPDGRVKPDIVGADGYVSLGSTRFGTSYAAPHVAGLAALVRQQNPTFTPEQTTEYLKTHAAPRGDPSPNNTFGHGFAQLPSLGCTELLNGDGSTSGSWTTNCMSVTDTQKSSQYYIFTLSQQSSVTIDLSSSVDSYLNLRRGYNNQKDVALHTDDDSGTGSNARISESLAAGTYTIEATTAATGRTGAFTLTVSGGLKTLPEISITAGADVTEGDNVVFTVTSNPAPTSPLDVSFEFTTNGEFGITPGSRTVTVPASGSATFNVATMGDSVDEADGSVTATINTGADYTVSATAGSATVAVSDDDGPPSSCDATEAIRWARAAFHWHLSYGSNAPMFWRILNTLGAENMPAKPAEVTDETITTADVKSFSDGNAWSGWAPIVEAMEQCVGTVALSPATPEVSITAGSAVIEGADATFTLTADPAPAAALSVSVAVTQSGDYATTGSHTVTIPASGSATLTVATTNDSIDEADGSVTATVDTGTGYTVSTTAGSATVAVSDDDVPEVSITSAGAVIEGADAVFTVTADPAPAAALDVTVAVTQSGDYITPGTHTVTVPTSGSATLTVPTTNDTVDEVDGSVTATVDAGTGYTVSSSAGSVTVAVSDDDIPSTPGPDESCFEHLTGDGTSKGSWSRSCASDERDGRYARFYMFELAQQSTVTIDLDSTVDNFLYLREGRDVWRGRALRYNDDRGSGDLDALIRASLSAGWYTIEATTYARARTGDFNLKVSGLPAVAATPEVAVTAGSAVIEGVDASFTLTAVPTPTSALSVTVAVTQSGDYITPSTHTVTIPTSGSATLTVPTTNDGIDEADGSVTATINTGTGYTVSSTAGSATVAVDDDDVPAPPPVTPEVSITAGVDITEGDTATFTVTADPAPTTALSVNVAISSVGDFGVTPGSRTVTVPTSGSATLSISTTGDSADEVDGSVTATLNVGTGYTVSTAAAAATVAVSDDDASVCTPNLPSDVVTVAEVTGWRDAHSGAAHVLRWNRVLAALGVSTGETEMTVSESRANESQFITSRWDRVTRTLEALAQCNNPPATPEVSIAAGSAVIEGADATFTLTAAPAPTAALSVSVAVTQSGDYITPSTHTVTIPTSGSATLAVPTTNDSTDEADGSVTATVDTGTGYSVSATAGSATVAVSDDDVPAPPPVTPEVSITAGADITEGDTATFTVTADPAPTTALSVSVAITQSGDFAVAAGLTVTIPDSGSVIVSVATMDDSVDESDGSVTATLNSGQGYTVSSTAGSAIVTVADDDDPAPPPPPPVTPEVSITAGPDITEGDTATFTLTANPAPAAALSVSVAVTQSGDYITPSTHTVTIPTSGSATLTVSTVSDSIDEADGSVTATIDTGTGYTVSTTAGSATVSVSDDDDPAPPANVTPSISVSDVSAGEGDGEMVFTVELSDAAARVVRVRHTLLQSTATWGIDFEGVHGLLEFSPGETSKSVSVGLIDDQLREDDETIRFRLYHPTNATFADDAAIGTIIDND